MSSAGQALVWVMGKGDERVALGSVRGNGTIHLRWNGGNPGFINRSKYEDMLCDADEWLIRETDRLIRDGYVFAIEPRVRVLNLPGHSTERLEKWAETVLFTRIMQEFRARV